MEFGRGANIRPPRLYWRTCSEECARRLRAANCRKTYLERYGVENAFQSAVAKAKSAETKSRRHWDPSYSNPEKRKATCLAKYGADSNMRSEKGLAEYKAGMKAAYGVEFLMQSAEVRAKAVRTCMRKYGRPDVSTPETVSKRRRTCLERHGVSAPMRSPTIRCAA